MDKILKGQWKYSSPVYHPVELKEQQDFNNILLSIWDNIPSSYQVINGQDINANMGIRAKDNPRKAIIGPNESDNQNTEGKSS